MEKKTTKKEMFAMIRERVLDNAEMVEFIDHEVELLNKKSANKKPSKASEENKVLAERVLEVLTTDGKTATEIIASTDEFAGMSNQKMTALLKLLIADGKVEKYTDKSKSLFRLA